MVELWEKFLSNSIGKLGDEGWLVLEQVLIAALDCGNTDLADSCLSELSRQFPGSLRVMRLRAMKYSAEKW